MTFRFGRVKRPVLPHPPSIIDRHGEHLADAAKEPSLPVPAGASPINMHKANAGHHPPERAAMWEGSSLSTPARKSVPPLRKLTVREKPSTR